MKIGLIYKTDRMDNTTVRSELNLVENPDMFGKYVVLQGDIVSSYFGIVGLKNVTSYVSR